MTSPTSAAMESAVVDYVGGLAAVLGAESGLALVGTYLHGSAVLGGFMPAASDIDVLAVVAEPTSAAVQARMGAALQAAAVPCPGTGLEMSVITASTALELGHCPFEVHVNAGRSSSRINLGTGHPGDPDLVLHSEICRRSGRAITGPPPGDVFGPVPRPRLLRAVRDEVEDALERSHTSYAVLNACRALRFAAEGVLCSKVDAGAWALTRDPDNTVIQDALAQQRNGIAVYPLSKAAARFVTEAHETLANS